MMNREARDDDNIKIPYLSNGSGCIQVAPSKSSISRFPVEKKELNISG
jgi:hypothetical protein